MYLCSCNFTRSTFCSRSQAEAAVVAARLPLEDSDNEDSALSSNALSRLIVSKCCCYRVFTFLSDCIINRIVKVLSIRIYLKKMMAISYPGRVLMVRSRSGGQALKIRFQDKAPLRFCVPFHMTCFDILVKCS